MPLLRFEGYSDDTFGEYAHSNDDYDNCASGEPIEYLVLGPAVDGQTPSGIVVTGHYYPGESYSWMIGVANYDPDFEDRNLPDWPMRIEPASSTRYNPSLLIEAPEGVTLRCLTRDKEASSND